jgi:type VI secretion system protein ImpK
MLKKIAKELENEQDSILVTGHTDDKPIVSARFPSNWHLSAARAKNVLAILTASAQLKGSARAEGRADGEPLAPNDTPEHRALNRRVDILIK